MTRTRIFVLLALALLVCCLLPADERVELDREVGQKTEAGWSVVVREGHASVRSLTGNRVELWAQAPVLELSVQHTGEAAPLSVDVLNCMPASSLTIGATVLTATPLAARPASCHFELPALSQATLRIAPTDADVVEPFHFAVLSDIQRGIDAVHEIFARMNEDPTLRFVVSTGDLTNVGERKELEHFQRELALLAVPFYSTVGNHEMGASPQHWHTLFGPFNVHFRFKGGVFSLLDSGNATVDPHVYDWLDGWLDGARADVHVIVTHIPPLDPVGLRGGGFRSRKEGAKLMQMLSDGRADALFLGHIHSYYAFSIAGVPAYISGGGGAIAERLDGIERHYLKVDMRPGVRLESVAIVRVD